MPIADANFKILIANTTYQMLNVIFSVFIAKCKMLIAQLKLKISLQNGRPVEMPNSKC